MRQVEDMLKRSFLELHAQKAAPKAAQALARCAPLRVYPIRPIHRSHFSTQLLLMLLNPEPSIT